MSKFFFPVSVYQRRGNCQVTIHGAVSKSRRKREKKRRSASANGPGKGHAPASGGKRRPPPRLWFSTIFPHTFNSFSTASARPESGFPEESKAFCRKRSAASDGKGSAPKAPRFSTILPAFRPARKEGRGWMERILLFLFLFLSLYLLLCLILCLYLILFLALFLALALVSNIFPLSFQAKPKQTGSKTVRPRPRSQAADRPPADRFFPGAPPKTALRPLACVRLCRRTF